MVGSSLANGVRAPVHLRLVAIKGRPNDRRDRLRYVRNDGSSVEIDMPRQGILPHDLVHALVEDGLGLTGGFMARVACGASPDFMESLSSDPSPDLGIAESTVEAMQAQLSQGHFDGDAFAYGWVTACESRGISGVSKPDLGRARAVFDAALALNERWRAVPPTQTLEVVFGDSAAKEPVAAHGQPRGGKGSIRPSRPWSGTVANRADD